jgi:hypothetical protein
MGPSMRLSFSVSQSMFRNQGCVLISATPPAKHPHRLLRSICVGEGKPARSDLDTTVCLTAMDDACCGLEACNGLQPTTCCEWNARRGGGAHLEQLSHQVPGCHREVGGKGEAPVQYFLIRLRRVIVVERRVARHHLEDKHAECPPVHGLPVTLWEEQQRGVLAPPG